MRALHVSLGWSLIERLRTEAVWFANSIAITAGHLVSSALGFAYWWIAARHFSSDAVGYAAGLISLMGLVGVLSESGLGSFLVGEAQFELRRGLGEFVSAALICGLVASVFWGLSTLAIASDFSKQLRWIGEDVVISSWVLVGCGATVASMIIDQLFLGLLKSHFGFYRNLSFAIFKLLLIMAAAASASNLHSATILVASWVIGSLLSLAFIFFYVGAARRPLYRPDFRRIFEARKKIFAHHILNISTQIPPLALPIVTVMVVGAQQNAPFFSLWTILNVLLFAPAALTTVLFTIVAGDPESLRHRLSVSLTISCAMSLVVAVTYMFGSKQMLALFNPAYVDIVHGDLRLLGFGFIALAMRYHYIAICRLNGTMLRAALFLAFGGVSELMLAATGGYLDGLFGLTLGWLIAVLAQAILMCGPLSKAIRGPAQKSPVHFLPIARKGTL